MLEKMLHFDVDPLQLVLRGVITYLSVLILLRIAGKKQMGQMGATEFVAILLISNAVQNAMNGGDNSLSGGLVLAVTLIVVSSIISYLTYRSTLFTTIFEGTPTLVIHRGEIVKKNLRRERLSESELKTLLRKQGVHLISELDSAILEADGSLTLAKMPGAEPTFGVTK